jgi:hypothetical protein
MIVYLKKMVGYLSGNETSLRVVFTATWSFTECHITTPTPYKSLRMS